MYPIYDFQFYDKYIHSKPGSFLRNLILRGDQVKPDNVSGSLPKLNSVVVSDTLEREKIRAMIKARKEKQKEQNFENEKAVCP